MADEQPKKPEQRSLGEMLKSSLKEVTDPFVALVHAPRALWGVNLSYLLDGLVYFGILTELGKYLSEDVGLSDLHAGWVMSCLTAGFTLAMLFLGGLGDRVGVRKALLAAYSTLFIGRIVLAASSGFEGGGMMSPMFLLVSVGLLGMVLGGGMQQPASYAGCKQFTNEKTATMGYAMLYGLMNLGAFLSGIIAPPVRQAAGIGMVFWVYVGLTLIALLSVFFILSKKTVEKDTLTQIAAKPEAAEARAAAAAKAPILSGRFIPYLVLTLAALGGLVYFLCVRYVPPAQQAVADAKELAVEGPKTFPAADDKDADLDAAGKRLRDVCAEFSTLAGRVAPPDPLPEGATTRPELLALVRNLFVTEAGTFQAMGCGRAAFGPRLDPASAAAGQVREGVRAMGIYDMGLAYALVGHVDAKVVETLRIRMKELDEDIIPLPAGMTEEILETTARPAPAMLRSAATRMKRFAADMLVLSHGEAKEIALLVAGDADALTVGALALEKTPSAEARTLVKDRLLLASVTLLSHVAPLLTADPEAEEKAPLVRGVDVLSARLAALTDEDLFARPMSTAASASIVVPFKTAALAWLWPYGVLIGLTLLFLILVIRDVLRKRPDHAFHNGPFVFFIFILIPVQTLFAHTWLTLPYYINRAFGGTWVGDNFEFFSNLNPILIFILSPMVAALTASRKVYPMMIAGTFVMGLPTFLLALGPNPGLLMAYIVLASIGEAMWQPRFLQWVAEIAPEGKTGAYMGIAQFPWFLTKVVTGLYSGWFLQNYCPMVGPQNTEFMWLIYGFIACSSSVALVLARGWASKGTAKHK